jgi:UDP-N-acetylmuramoyl-tripeptide--D-alanyl-D-alanine ligase
VLSGWLIDVIQLTAIISLGAWWAPSPAAYVLLAGWIVLLPLTTAHLLVVPLLLGDLLITRPMTKRALAAAREKFSEFTGEKIVVLGSFGKTSTKEIVATMLQPSLRVKKTEKNLNTPLALARFAATITGNEDVLVIELGEFRPGDIAEFCELVQPTRAIITGLNESHLDSFGTITSSAENLLSVRDFVAEKFLYINQDGGMLADFAKQYRKRFFNQKKVLGWTISKVKADRKGLSFSMKKGRSTLNLKTGVLGTHQVPVIALAAALAKEFKATKKQTERAATKIVPVAHRLEPKEVAGAFVIDDTYNGNIDGVAAGIAYVDGLKRFKRKIYITPGLVEQGAATAHNHVQIGKMAAGVFDRVVLMKNSVTDYILEGLQSEDFRGDIEIIDDPLQYYQSLESFLAKGDLVLMQNDWTDNYA